MPSSNVVPAPSINGVESDYERRILLATPEDTARGLFFNGVLSAVTTLGGETARKDCLAQLNDKRFERRFTDFASYPVSDFLRLALAATRVLTPKFGGAVATQPRLGMQATSDFLNSMAGRTLLLLSGDSPKRLIGNLASGYRSAVSYGERIVSMESDTSARVLMKRDFMLPHYNEGVLRALLESVHAKSPQVRSRPLGQLDCEYELSWS
jgi:uncharacterized protein (TIGR02265 family)